MAQCPTIDGQQPERLRWAVTGCGPSTITHTGGEPFGIVLDDVGVTVGDTVRERRTHAIGNRGFDEVRRLLCHEPRSHADTYGCSLTPPDDANANFGVLFWHKDGYSTACGHGTIALGVWAVQSGRVSGHDHGVTDFVIDVSSGRVIARVECRAAQVESVWFRNVPAYVLAREVVLRVLGRDIQVDVSYGGAIYASVQATDFGLALVPEDYAELIAAGRAVNAGLAGTQAAEHPSDSQLSGIYGTILYDDTVEGRHQRNVTVFADGEVDRPPGRVGTGRHLIHDSIVGSRFTTEIAGTAEEAGHDAVVTEIWGMAHRTGEHQAHRDLRDPLGTGFVLR